MKHLFAAGLLALTSLAATDTSAATVRSQSTVNANGCSTYNSDDSGIRNRSNTLAARGASGTQGCDVTAKAHTGQGLVGVYVGGGVPIGTENGSSNGNATAWAEYTFNIVAPDGYEGTTVGLTVNGLAHGLIRASQAVADHPFSRNRTATAQLDALMNVHYVDATGRDDTAPVTSDNEVQAAALTVDGSRFAEQETHINDILSTGELTVQTGSTLRVYFRLFGSGRYFANELAAGDFLARGDNTLSFAANAFVFDQAGQDAGFFLSNADAAIVNNQWIDPRGTPAVPLPSPALLLLGGFGALAALRRRQLAT